MNQKSVRDQIRVRFAPSPTGPLHIGGLRTALYNYLFARKHKGHIILRIEDTDRKRIIPGAEQYIFDSFHWCGLDFDESPEKGGPFSPYRQSERISIYQNYIQLLLNHGHAYYAFDTPEELETIRQTFLSSGIGHFQYDSHARQSLRNSFTLSDKEIHSLLERNAPYVIRIKVPENETVVFNDLIRGDVHVHTATLDDKILFKSDGFPTYHFANVVDDYLMNISHVIRGEEWLPSSPMHLLLYRFFGWESEMPHFAHLPLILKPEGTGKLSKRDGERLGFPVIPIEWKDHESGLYFHGYREEGYLPEALLNILALLGWNSGTEKEVFSLAELIELFTIERIHKSGSRFDPEKAKWFNHIYIQRVNPELLVSCLQEKAQGAPLSYDKDYCLRVIQLIKDRIILLTDLWPQSWYFFSPPVHFDLKIKEKVWKEDTPTLIQDFCHMVSDISPWGKDSLHSLVETFTHQRSIKLGYLLNPLRFLVVGSSQGPGLFEIAELLGKEEFISRISKIPE